MHSKISMFFLIVVFFSISFFVVRGYLNFRSATDHLQTIEQKKLSINEENLKLEKRLDYLRSDAYVEYEAKRVLGYKKQQESIVVISDSVKVPEKSDNDSVDSRIVDILTSTNQEIGTVKSVGILNSFSFGNYKKWFEYFFNNHK